MNKGSMQDIVLLGAMAFAVIFFGFIYYYAFSQASTAEASSLGNINITNMLSNTNNFAAGFINGLPIGLFIGGVISLALASFVPVSPVFLPLGIILLVASVTFFVFLQDAIRNILTQAFFVPLALQFPLAAGILNNIALVVGIFGILMLIVMYGWKRQPGGTPDI